MNDGDDGCHDHAPGQQIEGTTSDPQGFSPERGTTRKLALAQATDHVPDAHSGDYFQKESRPNPNSEIVSSSVPNQTKTRHSMMLYKMVISTSTAGVRYWCLYHKT